MRRRQVIAVGGALLLPGCGALPADGDAGDGDDTGGASSTDEGDAGDGGGGGDGPGDGGDSGSGETDTTSEDGTGDGGERMARPPQMSLDFEYGGDGTLSMLYVAGESTSVDRLYVVMGGEAIPFGDLHDGGQFEVGEEVSVDASGADEVLVTWVAPDGATSTVTGSFTVPDGGGLTASCLDTGDDAPPRESRPLVNFQYDVGSGGVAITHGGGDTFRAENAAVAVNDATAPVVDLGCSGGITAGEMLLLDGTGPLPRPGENDEIAVRWTGDAEPVELSTFTVP